MKARDKNGRFTKGNPGGGRKSLPDDILEARNLSYEEMCRSVIRIRQMTPAQVKKLKMEEISLGERTILNAYTLLDYKGVKDYEDRLWGKAIETKELFKHNDFGEIKKIFDLFGSGEDGQ